MSINYTNKFSIPVVPTKMRGSGIDSTQNGNGAVLTGMRNFTPFVPFPYNPEIGTSGKGKNSDESFNPEFEIKGSGLFDLNLNWGLQYEAKEILKKYGNAKIVNMEIRRQPVEDEVIKLLNIISLGSFDKGSKKANIDKYFHLFSILTLENGVNLLFDKIDRVNLTAKIPSVTPDVQNMNLGPPPVSNLTLNELVSKTENILGKERFFVYDAFKSNCQDFALAEVQAAGYTISSATHNFIKQPIDVAVNYLPSYVPLIAKKVTDVKAYLGNMRDKFRDTFGFGVENKKIKKTKQKKIKTKKLK
jgi:hypothetical protein